MVLIEDRAGRLLPSGKVRIVRIPARDIRINIVDCVRINIARQRCESTAEVVA